MPTTASGARYVTTRQPTVEHEKIDSLNYSSKNAHKQRPPRSHAGVVPPNRPQTKQKCGRCGKSPKHNKQQCPAKDSTCKKCHKRGHFTSCCFSKDVSLLREDDNPKSEEDAFLGCLESQGETQWHAIVNLSQKDIKFKLGTGAEVRNSYFRGNLFILT